MCPIRKKNQNTPCNTSNRDNVKKYVNKFFADSGTNILLRIKEYKADANKKKSMLKNVFKDDDIKKSLEVNLKELLKECHLDNEYERILWYAFSSNTNPDFETLLQRFMISVPKHANNIEDKIDKNKWELLEKPEERNIHEKERLGIYARYRSGKIPRDIDKVVLINANDGVGANNLKGDWRTKVLNEEKKGIFYLWMADVKECKDALFSANWTLINKEDRERFYKYMEFIWKNIDCDGEDAMLLYTAKPIAYAPGSIPENSIGEVYLAEYKQPLSKIARDVIIEFFENIALILHAQFAREDMVEIRESKIFKDLALRAAVAQVFARNTSHNIGAHVMNKLIGDLSSLPLFNFSNIAEYNYQSAFEKDLKKLHKEVEPKINDDNDLSLLTELQKAKVLIYRILLEQIALFNNYVKCRMDYLADISFGTPLMQTNKYAYGELFKDLDKVRLLLEHISGLSDFKYEIVFKKDGELLNDTNDLLVAIPNDILGTQAFYNILENIIRNTAKHASTKPDITTFTVNFIDDIEKAGLQDADNKTEIANTLNEFIAVEVYDNIPIEKTDEDLNLTDEDKKEYKAKTEKDFDKFDSYIDKLVFKQNKKLNEDILQDNKLRSYSLGLVEMDASAAYLRKRPVEYINHPSYDIQYDESWSRDTELNGGNQEIRGINCRHFLKAFKKENVIAECTTVENGTSTTKRKTGTALGYRLFLHRPAVVLVVTEELKNDKEKKDILRKEGIWVVDEATFREEIENKKEGDKVIKANKVYPHEFVVYSDYNVKTVIDEYKTSLPIRILQISNLSEWLDDSADEIEKRCWEEWEKKNNYPGIDIGTGINPRFKGFQAIFLDHLYSLKKNTPKQEWENKLAANHLEALSSHAQSKMPDFYKITQSECKKEATSIEKFKCYIGKLHSNELAKRKITEAVLSKIIVIDERIQEAADTRIFMEIPYKCLYAKMNVRVPDKSINLSANSYTEKVIDGIKSYITDQLVGTKSTDFILIHYSILERMYQKDKIIVELERMIMESEINVIITSGRGTPDNLSEKVRFVNLSSVITAFVDVRSKYAINYLLNSSRKSSKI